MDGMIKLDYKDKSFLKKSKEVLKSDKILVVLFEGEQANRISTCLPFLSKMQKFRLKKTDKISWQDMVKMYFTLNTRFWRFMSVFWISMTYGRRMFVLSQTNDSLEIGFEKWDKQSYLEHLKQQ